MKSTFPLLALLGLAACSAGTPTGTDSSLGPPLFARGGSQTLYAFTFLGGLQSDATHPFSALAPTGDPFSGTVSGDPVYLVLPAAAGGDATICNQDGSGQLPSTGSWGAYAGVWKGSFSQNSTGINKGYHLSYTATRADGTGWLYLVVNGAAAKSTDKLTLTRTSVRGLVSAFSSPTGTMAAGPYDSQDRCLTFSMTATP